MKSVIVIASLIMVAVGAGSAHLAAERRFTVRDDIEMSYPRGFPVLSPDKKYVLLETSRSLLDKSGPEDSLWVWSVAEIASFMHGQRSTPPLATLLVRMATYKDGPIISAPAWLDDSSGVYFVALTNGGNHQVFSVNRASKSMMPLTPANQDVTACVVHSGRMVYSVRSDLGDAVKRPLGSDKVPQVTDVTGNRLWDILFPQKDADRQQEWWSISEIWTVVHGRKARVEDAQTHQPVHILVSYGLSYMGAPFDISPNGRTLAVINIVPYVPQEWEDYAAPTGYETNRQLFKFGVQQVLKFSIPMPLSSYQLLDLRSGKFSPLVNAPDGYHLFEWNASRETPRWSSDSKEVILPNSFLPLSDHFTSADNGDYSKHPCVTVVNVPNREASCLLPIVAGLDKRRFGILEVGFGSKDPDTVIVNLSPWGFLPDGSGTMAFHRSVNGLWRDVTRETGWGNSDADITISLRESLNEPPGLMAVDNATGASKSFWEANPQLSSVSLGEASAITWQDKTGYEWTAGLVKPPDFIQGTRYPLVIQTHGFDRHQFLSHGATTTSFAARELAGTGIVVVQMGWNGAHFGTPQEASDQIAGFSSLVEKLDHEGLIDPERVGITGWSRSVYHTYAALNANEPKLAAASVIEGVNYGYWQYLTGVAEGSRSDDEPIGAKPFGAGLEKWMQKSPIFNLDKASAPLLMLETGPEEVLSDWEPYAVLYSLHKPVDMLLIPSGGHVETNPQQRLVTQGTTIDWFRFWLQGYENPDPAKAEQYKRWEHLRDLRHADAKATN